MTSAADIFEQSTPPLPPTAGKPASPATGERPSRKKAAKKRGGRVAHQAVVAAALANPKTRPAVEEAVRKSRRANGTRKPRTPKQAKAMKLDFATAMAAVVGLKEADTKIVTGIVSALQTVNKKSRQRVLDAVGRIFA